MPSAVKTRTLGDGRSPLRLDEGDPKEVVAVEILPAVGTPDASVARALEALDLGLEVIDANLREGWIVELPRERIGELAEAPVVEALHPAPGFPSLGE